MCSASRWPNVILLVVATALLAVTLVFNSLGANGVSVNHVLGLPGNACANWSQSGAFNRSTITPAGYAFSVWGVIYLYQLAWLAYCWSTAYRRLHEGGPYLCQYLATAGLLLWFSLSCLCNMTWIVLAERVMFNYSDFVPLAAFLIGITVTLYGCLVSSYWSLAVAKDKLASWGRRLDFWLTIALVQNGISLYAGWVTVASFINVELVLLYVAELEPQQLSGTICLSLLLAIVAAYVIADLTILDRVTRFVFMPHLVVAWACVGSIVKNFEAWAVNSVLTVALLCVVCCGLVVKVIAIGIRSRTSPLITGQAYQLKQADY